MLLKDPRSGIEYYVPGKFDWELSTNPTQVEFTPNVEDETIISYKGQEIFHIRKKRVGFWHSSSADDEDVESIEPGPLHIVRFLPGFCESDISPSEPEGLHVYPIPLYLNEKWVETLFVLISENKVSLFFHETYDSDDISVLSEQFLTRNKIIGGHVLWIQDERNGGVCPFPDNVLDKQGDILHKILTRLPKELHVLTEEEKRIAIVRRKKAMMAVIFILGAMIAMSMVASFIKNKNEERLRTLQEKAQGLRAAMAVQEREDQAFDILSATMHDQPDWANLMSRLYGATTPLIHRTMVLRLLVLKDHTKVHYVVSGDAFEKITDVRPSLLKKMHEVGLPVFGEPTMIPGSDLIPHIVVSGEGQLERAKKRGQD